MEKDFQSMPKKFWQTVQRLKRGKQNPFHTVFSVGGELLTSTEFTMDGGRNTSKISPIQATRTQKGRQSQRTLGWTLPSLGLGLQG